MKSSFATYQSPFSWRYGSPELRLIWSEHHKRLLWRRLWVALAETQQNFGFVSEEQVADLREHQNEIDIDESLSIERTIQHDLMAEVKVFAAQCPVGGGIIHYGATSMDIKDNAEALQIQQSLRMVVLRLSTVLMTLADLLDLTSNLPCIAFTHLQPAELTTYGYRFANHAQDLLDDYSSIKELLSHLRGKGFKGAVGNAASYVELLGDPEKFVEFENQLSALIGISFFPIATQTYTRKQDYTILSALSGLAGTIYKLAFDIRILQSQVIGEIAEPFGKDQIGSSAMPFKRNPIQSEKIDSIARSISVAPMTAWNNFAHSLLERTLDDSANRRTLLPETFLGVDELLLTIQKILSGLTIKPLMIQQTLDKFAPFAGTERLLMHLVSRGADRQEMHELIRTHSLEAWKVMEKGQKNNLIDLLLEDQTLLRYLTRDEILDAVKIENYLGLAPSRSHEMADRIRDTIQAEL